MKIWHLPPRYLDDSTLLNEQSSLIKLCEQYNSPFSSLDSLYQKYKEHHLFVALRLILVSRELDNRTIGEDIEETDILEGIVNSKTYDFDMQDVLRDIEILTLLWSEFDAYDLRILDCLEKLGLTDSEQLVQELNWINQELIEEYDL